MTTDIVNQSISMPIAIVPASPMNILDLSPKTLWMKNGARAPAQVNAKTAFAQSPTATKRQPNMMQQEMQSPLDKPFTPSIILMALTMPTPAKSVSGTATHQEKSPIVHIPMNVSMQMPLLKTSPRIVRISAISRLLGVKTRISSRAPMNSSMLIEQTTGKSSKEKLVPQIFETATPASNPDRSPK